MDSTSVIKSFRIKRKITQDDMAERLQVSRQTYNTFENNIMDISLDTIYKILDILNTNDYENEEFFNAIKQDYKSYK